MTVTSSGIVKGVKSGMATITAKTHNGKSAVVNISVASSWVLPVDNLSVSHCFHTGWCKGALSDGTPYHYTVD